MVTAVNRTAFDRRMWVKSDFIDEKWGEVEEDGRSPVTLTVTPPPHILPYGNASCVAWARAQVEHYIGHSHHMVDVQYTYREWKITYDPSDKSVSVEFQIRAQRYPGGR